jgi:hypothetical protein
MMRDLGKPAPEMSETSRAWLDAVKASKACADPKIVKIATEIASLIRGGGFAELGSAIDLARPAGLGENEAEDGVNQLIRAGFLQLHWRPRHRFSSEFRVCQPSDLVIELPVEPASANEDQRQRAQRLAAAAVAGLSLADLVSTWAEVLAKALASAGVDPDRQTGSEFLETVAKLLRSRTKALVSAPQLNS